MKAGWNPAVQRLPAVTVAPDPMLSRAVDRFIAQVGDPERLDRSEAARLLMVEGLVRHELLTPNDKQKDAVPRRLG